MSKALQPFLFIIGLVLIFFILRFDRVYNLPPQSVHHWRQADCLSFISFYEHSSDFLNPELYNLGGNGTGKAISDFPILYFIYGKFWSYFGKSEALVRISNLILLCLGLFFLSHYYFQRHGVISSSIILPLSIFTSTVISYYSVNFLMNIPALGFALVGAVSFLLYFNKKDYKFLIYAAIAYTLSGLLKSPGLLSMFAFILAGLMEIVLSKRISIKNIFVFLLPFTITIILVGLWYFYALKYNNYNSQGFFLIGILPIWKLSFEEINLVINNFIALWSKELMHWIIGILWILNLAIISIFHKNLSLIEKQVVLFLHLGMLFFMLLFFQVLGEHDYYLINMSIVWLITLGIAFYNIPKSRFSKIIKTAYLVAILLVFPDTSHKLKLRYSSWKNDYFKNYSQVYNELHELNNLNSINSSKKILVYPEPSINIPLYAMDLRGWTNFSNYLENSANIERAISLGAEYAFINMNYGTSNSILANFLEDEIYTYKNIKVYKLKTDMP